MAIYDKEELNRRIKQARENFKKESNINPKRRNNDFVKNTHPSNRENKNG